MNPVIPAIVILATVVVVILLVRTKRKDNNEKKDAKLKDKNSLKILQPREFNVGKMNPKVYASSNLCDSKILFNINAPTVDYGSSVPDNCPCMEFIQAP
jgi:hypothetical protein